MNFEQLKTEQKDAVLESFHREIQKLKEEEEKELEEKGEGSVHFRGLNPEELTKEDETIYQKLKNLELTEEGFYDWRRKVSEEAEIKAANDSSRPKSSALLKDSRYSFVQYIANKIGIWQAWEEKKQEFFDFKKEIARLKEEEIKKKERKEKYDPHLASILNVQRLTPPDMEIFKKLKDGSLKEKSEEFRGYRSEIFRECQEYFRREITKHKKLKEIIEKPPPEDIRGEVGGEALARFHAIYSRSNFLAFIQNELVKKAYEERKRRKKPE